MKFVDDNIKVNHAVHWIVTSNNILIKIKIDLSEQFPMISTLNY